MEGGCAVKLRLPFHMRLQGVHLGLPGAVGVAGLGMCLALYFSVLQPAQQRRDAARLSAIALQQRIVQAGADSRDKARPLDEQLAAFYGIFPREHDATDTIGKIAAIARRDGLMLQQAEYKAERDKTGKLTRFQMSLPLRGEYPTIRRFLSDIHAEIPIASLEQVQFERQKVGDSMVDAKVRLVLYLGKAS
jgi:Tfp pilus assembly protein PilO